MFFILHTRHFRSYTEKSCYIDRGLVVIKYPSVGLVHLKGTSEPARATIVAAKLAHDTREVLVVEPDELSGLPLEDGELVAGPDGFDSRGSTPGSGVLGKDDVTAAVTVIDLKLHVSEDESSDWGPGCHFVSDEPAFSKFGQN